MFTPQMFLESLWSCAPPPIVVSFLQWGVNFIKYVQRNPEVSSIKSFVGIQLHPNWLNACNLRFASNVGLSYNVQKWLCEFNNHMDSIGYPDVRLSFYTPNYFLLGTFRVSCLVSRLEFWFPVIGEARRLYFVLLGAEFFPHEIKKKTNGHPSPLRLRACHFYKWMEFCWSNGNTLFNLKYRVLL